MDRYGNQIPILDTVALSASSSFPAMPSPVQLTAGTATFNIAPDDYGTPTLTTTGRIRTGSRTMSIVGVQRVWTGNTSSDWQVGSNWDVGAAPGALDTVTIPTGRPNYPVLTQNTAIGGVTVEDAASIDVNTYTLTANANVVALNTGTITVTSGNLTLSGTNCLVAGNLQRLVVKGSYSLSGNVTTRVPLEVELGSLQGDLYQVFVDP